MRGSDPRILECRHLAFNVEFQCRIWEHIYSAGQDLQNDAPFMHFPRPETLLDRVYSGLRYSAQGL